MLVEARRSRVRVWAKVTSFRSMVLHKDKGARVWPVLSLGPSNRKWTLADTGSRDSFSGHLQASHLASAYGCCWLSWSRQKPALQVVASQRPPWKSEAAAGSCVRVPDNLTDGHGKCCILIALITQCCRRGIRSM